MSPRRRTPPHAFTAVRITPNGQRRLMLAVNRDIKPPEPRKPRTPHAGSLNLVVGVSASDFLDVPPAPGGTAPGHAEGAPAAAPAPVEPEHEFARELRVRLEAADERTGAESAHLDQVESVVADYLPGPPKLRLIR